MSIETVILMELRYKNHSTNTVTPFRLTSAPFDVTYNGHTWTAAGDLLSIGSHESNYELITSGVEIRLSGVNTAYQPIIEQNGFRNAPVDILLTKLPTNSNAATSAIYYHRGFAGTPVTEFDESSGSISIIFETQSIFKSLDRTNKLMTTSVSHHQSLHTGDTFFQYTADTGIGEETWRD